MSTIPAHTWFLPESFRKWKSDGYTFSLKIKQIHNSRNVLFKLMGAVNNQAVQTPVHVLSSETLNWSASLSPILPHDSPEISPCEIFPFPLLSCSYMMPWLRSAYNIISHTDLSFFFCSSVWLPRGSSPYPFYDLWTWVFTKCVWNECMTRRSIENPDPADDFKYEGIRNHDTNCLVFS